MRKNLTEIVFILDRSGSMSGLEGGHHRRIQFHDRAAEKSRRRSTDFNGAV